MRVRRNQFKSVVAAAGVLAALGAGCGSGSGGSSDPLVVSAASSLERAFTAYAKETGIDARQSFAGSDELAAQIHQGVKPDVYAAANTSLPDEFYKDGLVGKPTVFARNTLIVAVPADSSIHSIDDLVTSGTSIAIGEQSVPVGSYTHEVLDRLPATERQAILGNVRSEEPDVSSIAGKLTQGAIDAGFLYVTDVVATNGALRAIQLPTDLGPDVQYGAAVVTGAKNPEGARRFIDGLLAGPGAAALRAAGFKPPPGA